MKEFIKLISTSCHGNINNSIFDYYVQFSHEKFIDEYEEEEEKNSEKLNNIECTHFVINFLFDLLQFSF